MAVVQGYFIYGKSKGWKFHIKFRTVFCVLGLVVLTICALYWTLSWFGRDTKQSMVDYLGGYLSAQIKNFDTFMREGRFGSEFVNSVTFRSVIDQFGRLLGKPEWQRNLDLQFRYINGYSLGNCYTALYCYLHDFGYVGLVGLITLMAVISQTVFLKMVYGKKQNKISIMLLVYAYMYQAILLSFLSDRFFINIFNLTMVKYLLSWWLLRLILTKVRLKQVRVNVSHVNNI